MNILSRIWLTGWTVAAVVFPVFLGNHLYRDHGFWSKDYHRDGTITLALPLQFGMMAIGLLCFLTGLVPYLIRRDCDHGESDHVPFDE